MLQVDYLWSLCWWWMYNFGGDFLLFLFHSCETLVQLKMLEKLRSAARKKRHRHHFVRVRWLLRTWAALEHELPVGNNSARLIPFNSFHFHLPHCLRVMQQSFIECQLVGCHRRPHMETLSKLEAVGFARFHRCVTGGVFPWETRSCATSQGSLGRVPRSVPNPDLNQSLLITGFFSANLLFPASPTSSFTEHPRVSSAACRVWKHPQLWASILFLEHPEIFAINRS